MAGYGIKDANRALRERKDTRPRANYCGGCGEECNSLLCDDCKGTLAEGGIGRNVELSTVPSLSA
jgi:hypothetical protein